MELYGGGMMGPSNNYQLGGRIASSKRQSEYQGETRALKEASEEAARRQRKSGIWGGIGSFVGGTLGSVLGPWGTAAGAAFGRGLGESGYKEVDVGVGKYRQQTREDIAKGQEEYKEGRLERALVSGIQAGLMPEVYGAAGKWLKGLGGAKEAAQVADIAGAVPEFAAGFGTAPVHEGMAASGLGLSAPPQLGAIPSMTMPGGFGTGMAGRLGAMPTTVAASAAPGLNFGGMFRQAREQGLGEFGYKGKRYHTRLAQGRGGGLINYMIPQMQGGGRAGTEYDPNRPQQQQQQQTNPYGQQVFGSNNPVFGPGTDWSGLPISGMQGAAQTPSGRGINTAYGTATDVGGALTQMGMGNIMNDPRFAQYAGDLPQFGMGYSQQVGDIYTGGKQATRSIRGGARTAVGQRGFGRSGIGSQQLESAVTGLTTDIDRQRRGVVEGYQADVLAGIQDIERKGEFEFDRSAVASVATPPGVTNIMNQNPNMSQDDAEEQYEQEMQGYYDQQYG